MAADQIIAERYELITLIDEGGMGQVFQARDTHTGEIVAIKVLKEHVVSQDPTLVERFCREAVVLRKLNHPNIVRVYDTFEEDGHNYIIMEFVSGGSLAHLIREKGALPIERATQIALDLADALTRTHRLNVIHRDLKPGNVLLAEDGSPRLTDFGVAHVGDAQTLMTQAGSLLGTIAYLSPEVSEGGLHTEKSDIWSFGLVIYEMLTGVHPYHNEASPANMLTAILRKPVPDVRIERPDVPEDLAILIDNMLAKDPNERIGSVREVGFELERVLRQIQRREAAAADAESTAVPSRFDYTPATPLQAVTTVGSSPTPPPNAPLPVRTTTEIRSATSRIVTNPRFFIAYRREDSGEIAGRLYDQLARVLGSNSLVRDVDRFAARTVSRYVLANDVVGSVDVMLLVIGPGWAGMPRDKRSTETGRAIDNPKDVVRMHIEAGLRRPEVLMMPVLVNGGVLPDSLPGPLEGLRDLRPFVITSDQPFDMQVKRLIRTVNEHFGVKSRERFPRKWIAIGLIIAALLALLAIAAVILSQSNATPTSSVPVVEPVAPGEYMVLLAELESLQGSTRDSTRFISDDLVQRLENDAPFSPIRVRRTSEVITSKAEADAAAEANGATVVIWGSYSNDQVDVQVQVGSLGAFSHIPFSRETLDQLANVRVRLTDERSQTVASEVLTILTMLHNADGNGYELLRTLTILNVMQLNSGEVVGSSAAALTHRALDHFVADTSSSLDLLDQAVRLEGGNPLLYLFRAVARQRVGDFAGSAQDLGTARRLAPAGWLQPDYLLANTATFTGDYQAAVGYYDRIVEGRPDDWFPVNYRGALYYLLGDYESARRDLDAAIALGPNANFPYPFATLIAMRDGRIDDARALMRTVLTEFPDPAFANRTLQALYGQDDAIIWGPFFSAYTNLILGQYNQAITEVEQALAVRSDLADLYLLEGLAQCNLQNYAEADEAYSRGLDIEPEHPVLLALRAESLSEMGQTDAADADMAQVRAMDLGDDFTSMINDGTMTCVNFFATLASG